jgi:hypothetical protein
MKHDSGAEMRFRLQFYLRDAIFPRELIVSQGYRGPSRRLFYRGTR